MAEGARPDTARLQRLARAYRESGALLAAVEPGLFTGIARGFIAGVAGCFEAAGFVPGILARGSGRKG